MPEVKNVSPVAPIAASAPVQSNNGVAASGDEGQNSFSQVLRDKQVAAANASSDVAKPAKTQDKDTADGNTKLDAKGATQSGASDTEVSAKTPAEMAQLLVAAGLLATANQADTPGTTGKDADQVAALSASDAAGKVDRDIATLIPATDKTAAASTTAAASLAATAATSANSSEQALAAQAQLTNDAGKRAQGAQTATSGGEQQPADKQPLVAIAGQADADKTSADKAASESSFSAALERASQNSDATRNAATPLTTNVAQPQTAQAPATAHTVATPVGRQGWADEVGQRVLWTAKSDSSRADLILTPPQLGRIEVSIHMNGDQANANFMVANPVAREALQDAMPRLRELMSQAGIQLGQADVSAGQSGQNSAQGERRRGGSAGGGMLGADLPIGTSTASGWSRQGTGIVDTFA